MEEYDIEKLTNEINFEENFIGYNQKGIVLTNKEIDVLKRNEIDYEKYTSVSELLYDIDEILNYTDDEELEVVSENIFERNYYLNTNK